MKKIIAFILCSASSCLGLNMPSTLKPNPLSQSWNNLLFTSKTMIIAASIISIAGILCSIQTISSEQSARKEADKDVESRKEKIKSRSGVFNLNAIKKEYDDAEQNPATFRFGLFGLNEFEVRVNLGHTKNPETQETTSELFIELNKKRPSEFERHIYDAANKTWKDPLIFKVPQAWYQRFFNLF